jgi:SAM-dependent methyltransferase
LLPPLPAKLLDMGCGTGWTSIFFAKKGFDVTGQDISPDMIDLANKNKELEGLNNLDFVVSDYETATSFSKYDCVVFYDSLHHAENEKFAIQKAFNSLKKDGILITLEPGEGHSKASVSVEVSNKFGVTEKDMPPEHIIKIGKEVGFKRFKVYPRYSIDDLIPLYDSQKSKLDYNLIEFVLNLIKVIIRDLKRSIKKYNKRPSFLTCSNIVILSKL